MRIKLLSGNQKGSIVDHPTADILIRNGLAELAPPELVTPGPVAVAAPIPEAEGGALIDDDDVGVLEAPVPDEAVPARVRRRTRKPKTDAPASRRKRR